MIQAQFAFKKLVQLAVVGLMIHSSITLAGEQYAPVPLRELHFSTPLAIQKVRDDAFVGNTGSQAALPETQLPVSAADQMRHDTLAGGPELPAQSIHLRASAAGGARYLGSQVMDGDAWGGTFRLSLSAFRNSDRLLYGLDMGVNAAWSSRFNSVNNPTFTDVVPVGMYNSPSLDFLAFLGYRWHCVGVELGGGYQISWIKWRNSPQQSNSGFRGVPKIRVALSFVVTTHTDIFVAASHTFNIYDKLRNPAGAVNTFQDSGYVAVTGAAYAQCLY